MKNRILILNVGSSSIKYSLFEGKEKLENGLVDRVKNYEKEIKKILKKIGGVHAIGHRVVHGGDLKKTILISQKILKKIKKYSDFAPLHNPPEIKGIEICKKLLPKVKQYAVFDTAFHSTIPEKAAVYGIPYSFYQGGIKRYGFHGTSHKYAAEKTAIILKKPLSKLKVITCHLGNGSSIAAINKGKSVDTSMGFTPLEGLLMGTRPGDLDPGILLYLFKNFNLKRIYSILNQKSGLLGISGISNDIRDLVKSNSKRAKLALDVFVYRIVKYIGAYTAVMKGVDAIVFTAGIGEHNSHLRKEILKNFEFLNLKLDDRNNRFNKEIITKPDSKIKVLVIKADEEVVMASEILEGV